MNKIERTPENQAFIIETGFEAETGRAMVNLRHSSGLNTWLTPEMCDGLATQLIAQAASSTLWQAIAEDAASHEVKGESFSEFQTRVTRRYKDISDKGDMYFE